MVRVGTALATVGYRPCFALPVPDGMSHAKVDAVHQSPTSPTLPSQLRLTEIVVFRQSLLRTERIGTIRCD